MSKQDQIRRRRARAHALRAGGLTLPAIAEKLGCSRSTVAADLAAERPEVAPIPNIQDESGRPVAGAEAGNTRAVTSAAYSSRLLAPRVDDLVAELRDLVPAYGPADEPALRLVAFQLARVEAAKVYLGEHGLWDAAGEPRPIVKVLSTWENSARQLLDRLGMTPLSRAQLGVDLSRAKTPDGPGPLDLQGSARELPEGES